jgi:hypothetical protein
MCLTDALVPAQGPARLWLGSTIQGMAFDELLADRVRTCLQQIAGVSERKIFGGLAFMTGGHLTVGVYGYGLIARIGARYGRSDCPAGYTALRHDRSADAQDRRDR